jgi:hypothetical protein
MISNRHFTLHVSADVEALPLSPERSPLKLTLKNEFYTEVQLEDEFGNRLGCLIGHVIDCDKQKIIRDNIVVKTCKSYGPQRMDKIEEALYRYAGSWLCIIVIPGSERIYLDPSASLGIVYDSQRRIVGSSAAAILSEEEYESLMYHESYEALDVEHMGWFPAGLTAHKGVKRLLPNHYLDLRRWKSIRHWPVSTSLTFQDKEPLAYERIAQSVRNQIESIGTAGPIAIALTAGNETRFLLGCIRGLAVDATYVTVDGKNTALDSWCATELAKRYGLQQRLLPIKEATASAAAEWSRDVGHCVGGVNRTTHPSVDSLKDFQFFVGGIGGEVGRAFWYSGTGTSPSGVNSASLIQRMGLPKRDFVRRAIDEWLDDAPQLPSDQLLDLAYIELRIGPWAFAPAYTKHPTQQIHPIATRENYSLLMSLPEHVKRNNAIRRAIAHIAPDLLDVPINSYGDVRDFLTVLRKLLQPHRIASKLRRRTAR